MPHTKKIRRFSRSRAGINGPVGSYLIRIEETDGLVLGSETNTPRETTVRLKGTISPLKPLTNHFLKLKRNRKNKMRMVNIEFNGLDMPRSIESKEKVPHMTTTLTFSDYLCKWCLTYVGQRRQFCSADCAAQFKLCQRRREQKQNLNISVDYYGNVKLSIQGLPLAAGEELPGGYPYAGINNGGGRRVRRRRRCRNCAKLLPADSDDEFCDETCHDMFIERSKKDEFVNVTQQKDAAERRRIRKWLTDAQDHYTKQIGDGHPDIGVDISSGPAALNPLPVIRTPLPITESILKRPKESARSLGNAPLSFRRIQQIPEETYKLQRDEVVTGGPVTLNPIPLRKGLTRRPRTKNMDLDDPDKRHLMIDLNWIPKFNI